MPIAVTIRMTGMEQVRGLLAKLPGELEKNIGNATYNFARQVEQSLRMGALEGDGRPSTPERTRGANQIRAYRKGKLRSEVRMPQSMVYLDSARAHYVSLKHKSVSLWVRRNYGTYQKAKKSMIYGLSTGKPAGALYFTPMPFVTKSLGRVRNRLPNELRKGVRRAFQSSKR